MVPLLVLLTLLSAQRASGDVRMELSFSRVAVKAGESAALPIYLVSPANYQEPFQITLEFSDRQLTFQKVEADYLAQKAKWTIGATVTVHPDKPDSRILRIDIKPGESKFFPSGGVAHAHFLVSKDSLDGDILLNAALIAPVASEPVSAAAPAKITVFTTAVYGCFFYMH